jgi:hypothetical protein
MLFLHALAVPAPGTPAALAANTSTDVFSTSTDEFSSLSNKLPITSSMDKVELTAIIGAPHGGWGTAEDMVKRYLPHPSNLEFAFIHGLPQFGVESHGYDSDTDSNVMYPASNPNVHFVHSWDVCDPPWVPASNGKTHLIGLFEGYIAEGCDERNGTPFQRMLSRLSGAFFMTHKMAFDFRARYPQVATHRFQWGVFSPPLPLAEDSVPKAPPTACFIGQHRTQRSVDVLCGLASKMGNVRFLATSQVANRHEETRYKLCNQVDWLLQEEKEQSKSEHTFFAHCSVQIDVNWAESGSQSSKYDSHVNTKVLTAAASGRTTVVELPSGLGTDVELFAVMVEGPGASIDAWVEGIRRAFARRASLGTIELRRLHVLAKQRYSWLHTVGELADYAKALVATSRPM